jgi:hypothetical protein
MILPLGPVEPVMSLKSSQSLALFGSMVMLKFWLLPSVLLTTNVCDDGTGPFIRPENVRFCLLIVSKVLPLTVRVTGITTG